jgi:hypothetical protein
VPLTAGPEIAQMIALGVEQGEEAELLL